MRIALGTLAASIVFFALGSSRAQEGRDPLLAGGSDPVALRRIARTLGDDAVLAKLSAEETTADVRLAAIHAAPALAAPERALEALTTLALGRDPDVAPAAAQSALGIVRSLDPRDLDRREVMREELAPAHAALARLSADETARGDLRRAADVALAYLIELGAPAPE